ncbi:ladderlectin-like isoform X1 [Poecilia reticulata]|uniref:ladderlectin-like isoform X1 n=1 Tax=Poecilia reticulata TaxID=8081 RepID=UPI0004A4003C|nr:PREDICTED: ladderlectin-like isoform X1 [Poecilia reticulata]XP_008434296.1 PREDICTED: ladderlectin-like isoform X1 [Poecilia reticulata]XP_008434297.1 PREDICTED: ladderlectin-like isoform X1 [Poecilia reticulata]
MKLLAVFLLVFSVVIQTSITCPSGWMPINNRCFLYVPNDMTWANAEKNCLSMGANLASVHNRDEYRWVQNLIAAAGYGSKVAWIGGTDGQQESTWFWSDGSRMIYTNWCPGQPDNGLGSQQHCLQMNFTDKKCWDDCWCHYPRSSVCAKKV